MIDPAEPLEKQVEKQAKIIEALVQRADREHDIGNSAYSLFQSAIALQGEVWEKTKDLERALDTLGRASNALQIAEYARDQTQRNLADALEAMEGGFALFTDERLQICNDQFKRLIPNLEEAIVPGLTFDTYFEAVEQSPYVSRGSEAKGHVIHKPYFDISRDNAAPFVLGLKNDRWFQLTHKRTSSDSIVVLQTEITNIVRQNRVEHDRLIDEQAHFLQAAFDHMSQGVCTFSQEGTLLIQNARFGDLLGLPYSLRRKDIAFGQILEYVKDHKLLTSTASTDKINTWVAQLRTNKTFKERVRHARGAMLDIHAHTLPDGGFIVNIMDVTVESQTTESLENRVQERTAELMQANARLVRQHNEQEQVEEQLRLAKEEAEAAVSSKTRFFAAASHDLLQPINAAKLFISTLVEMSRNSTMEETVDRLDRSFTSIESLLHAVLDISRLEATGTEISVTAFCIDDILQSIKEDYSQLAAEKHIRLDVVPSSIWVKSDHRYLLRCIQNLVVNAIQYTHEGKVLVGCRRKKKHVVFEVWDTGVGISKKDQQRIFTEFTRVKSDKSGFGMGLGLSIVDRACRHLGHKVDVRSKPQVGSVFSITIETAEPTLVPAASKVKKSVEPDADMDLIVVIVENDPSVLFATTQKIESWGGSVLAATGTEEAVQLVREIGMAPDIILADYQLEDGDNGIKSIMALREETQSDIPAIMITANREDYLTRASQQYGFTVLTKPVQISRLRPLIDWKTRHFAAE